MTIGERIKVRREELNMTQDELAKKCGYKSRSSINKIELSRDLPLNKVELMANALETTPSKLMGWEEQANEYARNLLNMGSYIDNIKIIPEVSFETEEALKMYELYKKADPSIKAAIETLLKGNKGE